ncbi:MAG: homocysteine S-methyltransferase family protein [Acidobacteriota bacterium]
MTPAAAGAGLTRRLEGGAPLILDGAMGSELHRRGLAIRLPLWSAQALLEHPKIVRDLHSEHAEAGADILTANTFRTNPRTLERCGLGPRQAELSRLAVHLAREAAERSGAAEGTFVAGSVAPVEDCYRPDLVPPAAELQREHRQMARSLADAGSDLLLVETMNTLREARVALEAARATGLPVWVSFMTRSATELLSGEDLAGAARAVACAGASAVLINCAPLAAVGEAFKTLRRSVDLPCGLYPNHGHRQAGHGWRSDPLDAQRFEQLAEGWFRQGARIVGGCCGTTPQHVRIIASVRASVLRSKQA